MSHLHGLSAFPLTPLHEDRVDATSFANLIHRIAAAGADSIGVLGSTGSYAYLDRSERAEAARLAVEHAAGIAVIVGVSALRTSHVLDHVRDAECAGASAVLLAPMSYQPLTERDVFELYKTVAESTELPIVVYDNPGTTHFSFTPDLYARIAQLPGIASIKIPGVPTGPGEAKAHIQRLRGLLPEHITLGVSGDKFAVAGLIAGCDAWYSVIGGTLPKLAVKLARMAAGPEADSAEEENRRLAPLWDLFLRCSGSLRCTAAVAEILGLVQQDCLPLPIQRLEPRLFDEVRDVVESLKLAE